MKRCFSYLTALCIGYVCAYPITIKPGLSLVQNSNTFSIEFSMPDYIIKTDTITISSSIVPNLNESIELNQYFFSHLQPYGYDYFDYLTEDGRPVLPFYSLNLLLPHDASDFQVTDIQIIDSTIIQLDYDYIPAQERNDFYSGFSYDADYYGSYDCTWHWAYYTINPIRYRRYPGFVFSIFPCRYEPSTRTLIVIEQATFEISYDGSSIASPQDLMNHMEIGAYNFFHNYVAEVPPTVPAISDKYLIITADDLVNSPPLSTFVTHKQALGYDVTLRSVHETGETPTDIRNYIRNQFLNNDMKFVLLVGDTHSLPVFEGDSADEDNPPSDLYYSCLSYADASNQWKDLSPSVYLGRWPVSTTAELDSIVEKTIASDLYLGSYLQNYEIYRLGIFSGTDTNDAFHAKYNYNSCKYIYEHVIEKYNQYYGSLIDGRSFLSNNDAFSFLKEYIEDRNPPTWFFIYIGHGETTLIGSPYLWSILKMSDIQTNTLDFQPFGFGFTCFTGNILYDFSFAKYWLTSIHGGVTYFGATTNSYMNQDRYLSRALFNQLNGDRPLITIGEFVGNGKANFYNPCKTIKKLRQAKKYILFGDPSLYLSGIDINYYTPYQMNRHSSSLENYGDYIMVKNNLLELSNNVTSFQIYSIAGQLLVTGHTNSIDLRELPSGAYTAIINTIDKRISKKIILQ